MAVNTSYRLLIVEDDPDISAMLQEYFERQGYRVRATAWGEEAIAQCREAPPDLILLDVHLPDIDGFEVFARLRGHFRHHLLPVIFLTERRGRDEKLTGLELGAVDYITKPFDLEELSLRVRNAVSGIVPIITTSISSATVEQVHSLIDRGEWAALYLRLQALDSLGGAHSSQISNKTFQTVAKALESVAESGGDEDFVVHLSGNDFVLVTAPSRVDKLRGEIVARLPRLLRRLSMSERKSAGGGTVASRISVGIGLLSSTQFPSDGDQGVAEGPPGDVMWLESFSLDL